MILNPKSKFEMPGFSVFTGQAVKDILEKNQNELVQIIEKAYLTHETKDSANPNSSFIRFPKQPLDRIIALPAWLGGSFNVSGIKWIASFPENVKHGIPRASAVLLLNDQITGYPVACMEASLISAYRTAISAVIGAYYLNQKKLTKSSIGLLGAGPIAANILKQFIYQGWKFEQVKIFDISSERAKSFINAFKLKFPEIFSKVSFEVVDSAEDLVRQSDILALATVASQPHLLDVSLFSHNPIVLNISLRDLAPEILLQSENIVDDVDHVLNAQTSPHLAYQKTGNKDFINGTLAQLINEEIHIDFKRLRIFSPFGLGVLDIALAQFIWEASKGTKDGTEISDFYSESLLEL